MAVRFGYSFRNVDARIKILQELLPAEMREKMQYSDLEERISKLEFTLALLLKKLSSDDDDE